MNEDLQYAIDNSQDMGNYPDFFDVNIGKDFHLKTRPDLFVKINSPRTVKIEITTYRGISIGAEHYYASIIADGINICSKEIRDNKECVIRHGGYICEEYSNALKENSIWKGIYSIDVLRTVTQEMIDANPTRWEHYEAGDKTNAFDTKESVIEVAKKITAARFSKDWVVKIDDLTV